MKTSQAQSTPQKVNHDQRKASFRQKGTIVWMTGLSGAGKTTLSIALENALF
jgi:adenylylsulfate kinase-like enzyme